jgi:hypothetical protein
VLSDIVAILVDDELRRARVQLLEEEGLRRLLAVLEHPLHDPAAILMSRQGLDLADEGGHDERDVLGVNPLDRLLDDMVAVLILDALEDLGLEFLDQGGLLVGEDVLESFLNDTASVHLERQLENVPLHRICQNLFLGLIPVLEELLDDIIAKYVRHQLNSVWQDFVKELILFVTIGGLEL